MSGNAGVAERSTAASYLGRLLDVLATIGESDGITLSELGRRTHLSMSTTHRLVSLLIARGFATRSTASKLVVSGPRLERLGLRALRRAHEPERFEATVARLADATGESVSLGLVITDELILVARKESAHSLRAVVRIGDVVPIETSAMGKAVLAFSSPDARRRLLAAPPDQHDVLGGLDRELKRIRKDRYARDEQTFAVGLRCIAAPFYAGGGEPAGGVSIAGPAARFTERISLEFAPLLIEEVDRLSHELGSPA